MELESSKLRARPINGCVARHKDKEQVEKGIVTRTGIFCVIPMFSLLVKRTIVESIPCIIF